MFKPAALVAAVSVALLVPVAAQARAGGGSHHFQRLAAQKERELRHAQAALRSTRAQVVTLRGNVTSLESQVTSLQGQATALAGQVTDIQNTLAQRTNERDAAQAQASSLQAKLDAIPAPLAVAVEQVRREAAYQESSGLMPYSHGRLVAQAAMDYVVGHVDASAYGYLRISGLPIPSPTPNDVLGAQAGICGHAALTFAAIVERLGLQARSVQFYYTDPDGPAGAGRPDSHIAVGVSYDGGWHFFDPTFGAYWEDSGGNVLDITDIRAGLGTERKDAASFTNLAEDFYYGDSTAFETDPATVVELDKQAFTG